MTLIYKEFIIKGTVEEIKEFIELMETRSNTVNTITNNFNIPNLEEYTKSKEYNSIDKRLHRETPHREKQ